MLRPFYEGALRVKGLHPYLQLIDTFSRFEHFCLETVVRNGVHYNREDFLPPPGGRRDGNCR